MLSVVMLSVIMLSVVMLNVITPSVTALFAGVFPYLLLKIFEKIMIMLENVS
jgi:hypothetical protein